jgi:addiction module RelB/DinJ family antitoxin
MPGERVLDTRRSFLTMFVEILFCSYTVAMKDSVIRARVDSRLKAKVLAECGLEQSDAIRMFLQQVVRHQGLPFDVRGGSPDELSMAELEALKKSSQQRDYAQVRSGVRSHEDMLLLKPARIRKASVRWPKARLG